MENKIYKKYFINGDNFNFVTMEVIMGSFVLVRSIQIKEARWQKKIWTGVGCFDKKLQKYYGIFKYADDLQAFPYLSGVIGLHIGTVDSGGENIRIFGINLSSVIGFFNCTWTR